MPLAVAHHIRRAESAIAPWRPAAADPVTRHRGHQLNRNLNRNLKSDPQPQIQVWAFFFLNFLRCGFWDGLSPDCIKRYTRLNRVAVRSYYTILLLYLYTTILEYYYTYILL